jgi:hypothetical protein
MNCMARFIQGIDRLNLFGVVKQGEIPREFVGVYRCVK